MSVNDKVFVPSDTYEAGPAHGMLSPFEPGTRTLPAGWQIDPKFSPLPTDIVLEKDIAVTLRDGVTIYVDVLRPAGTAKVRPSSSPGAHMARVRAPRPASRASSAWSGWTMASSRVWRNGRVPTRPTGAHMATRSAIPTPEASPTQAVTASCGIVRRGGIVTISSSGWLRKTGAPARSR